MFHSQALNYVVGKALFVAHPAFHLDGKGFGPMLPTHELHDDTVKEVANGVVHPVIKETITKYQKIIKKNLLREIWELAMRIELGCLVQGFKDTKGTDTMRFIDLDEI